ncbi:MAG TPA: hypothetical protein PKD18_08735 [Saprospiraceae bacterium]|nr:hypothetical protein [Saprospiraceae bacterium]
MKNKMNETFKTKIRSWFLITFMIMLSGILHMSCEKDQIDEKKDNFYIEGWIEEQNKNVLNSLTVTERGKGKNSFKKALKKAMQKSGIRRKQIEKFGYIAWENIELIYTEGENDFLSVPIINTESKYVEAVLIAYESASGEDVYASLLPRTAIPDLPDEPLKQGQTTIIDKKAAALIVSYLDLKLFGRTTCTLRKIINGELADSEDTATKERAEYCFSEPVETVIDWYNYGGGYFGYSDTTYEIEWVTVCWDVSYPTTGSGGGSGGSGSGGTTTSDGNCYPTGNVNCNNSCSELLFDVSIFTKAGLFSPTKYTYQGEVKANGQIQISACYPTEASFVGFHYDESEFLGGELTNEDESYITKKGGPKRPMYCPNTKKTIPGDDQFISAKYFAANSGSLAFTISDSGVATSWSKSYTYLKTENLYCAAY